MGDIDSELKLFSNIKDREMWECKADIYSMIVTMEHLEKAYIRDSISAADYSKACSNLIAQYKTATAENSSNELESYKKIFPAASSRFKIGVPATVEHSTHSSVDHKKNAQFVAETVQHFITLMDSLKMNLVAVDSLHPLLSDLVQSLNKVSGLPPDFEAKVKLKNWLVSLNKMKASDELNPEQTRQFMFDLETSHGAFYNFLR
jgi:ESCRT-I complex subunit VPS28